jgi:hypothetical protein
MRREVGGKMRENERMEKEGRPRAPYYSPIHLFPLFPNVKGREMQEDQWMGKRKENGQNPRGDFIAHLAWSQS